ncbi:hypothetical protein EJV47_01200 [Hymenobacter gummosus]|uniref:Uncharacterized protein n=1 Tax=Hymenobacter gummosus TaxID=1776032 RepID=A0A3S0JDI8_9BACT|nr:Imm50 family immunity protein [Hymenobacter gummosus]RTQ53388.1 hypothetical protein EJV47_01200 [Hymenobacter gummosus]
MAEVENPVISRIINADLVRQHFGYWPAFHDAEVTKATFESNSGFWPSVTFLLTASEMAKKVDETGYRGLTKRCDIELQFTGVQEIAFHDFSHQNVLLSLMLEEDGRNIKCTFGSSTGLDAIIVAEQVTVLSLTSTKR